MRSHDRDAAEALADTFAEAHDTTYCIFDDVLSFHPDGRWLILDVFDSRHQPRPADLVYVTGT
jgi:hypothetical protein